MLRCLSPVCRNGAYPIKGIDTTCNQTNVVFFLYVEMERTRLRELTLPFIVTKFFTVVVEMERTRLRELTHPPF